MFTPSLAHNLVHHTVVLASAYTKICRFENAYSRMHIDNSMGMRHGYAYSRMHIDNLKVYRNVSGTVSSFPKDCIIAQILIEMLKM